MRTLRRLVWLYFWLLLFEGALRKWIVPGLSGPLLIVRDPVALAIYFCAFQQRVFPRSAFVLCTGVLAAICAVTSMAGIGTLPVTIYGLRADFLHLPLIVVLPRILRPEDVRRMGYALLALLPAMAVLAAMQFKGGPDSRWNVGVGGELGGQLYASEGKVRVSGTFSFVTGIASYLALCAAFLLADLLARRSYPRWMQWASGPALLFILGVSGSRTAVMSVAVVCAAVAFIVWRKPAHFGALVRPILLAGIALLGLVAFTTSFKEGISLQQERFSGSGGVKTGIVLRYLQTFNGGWHALSNAPPLGYGIGVGTNAGAGLLTGKRAFTLGEGEWQRVILESGPLLGTAYLALRCSALIMIVAGAFHAYRAGRILPMLLLGAGGLDLLTGQFGQPTVLGFAVLTTGLSLSATGLYGIPDPQPTPPVPAPEPRFAGRSRYAERLHGSSDAREP